MRVPLSAVAPAAALAREWQVRNDRGALASGTASGVQVRLRHAALATIAVDGRLSPLLLRLDARAADGHHVFDLTWRPSDARAASPPCAAIESFRRRPWPTWRYRAGPTAIDKELLLVHDHPAIVATWRHVEGPPLRIAVTPTVALDTSAPPSPADGSSDEPPDTPATPAAAEDQAADAVPADRLAVQAIPGRVRLGMNGAHRLTVWHDGAFLPARSWRRRLDGAADPEAWLAPLERGDVPGFIEATLGPGMALHVVIAAEEGLLRRLAEGDRLGTPPPRSLAGCVTAIAAGERRRIDVAARAAAISASATSRSAWIARHPGDPAPAIVFDTEDPWVPRLAGGLEGWASRSTGGRPTPRPYLAAGGVQALRAVRGLVALGRFEPAREVLLALGQLVRDGIVPSAFDDSGVPRYDSPEPSLWFAIASELFARRSGEHEFVRHALLAPLEHVIDRYRAGTRLGIRLRDDGLLVAGEDGVARADLNALWYAAQAAMAQLAKTLGRKQNGAFYRAWAREQQVRFNEALWDETLGIPYLALTPGGPVRGLEPSLLLAASLAPPLLPPERVRSLVDAIERELATPAGPREAPGAPRILPGWAGDYLSARLRAAGRSEEAQAEARRWLRSFDQLLDLHAAGQVPEAFETDADRALDGARLQVAGEPVALAGTAELLRFWVEDLDHAEAESPATA